MKTLLILFGKLMVKILKLLGKNAGLCPLDTHKTPLCQSIHC